jgi:hypothetical protein
MPIYDASRIDLSSNNEKHKRGDLIIKFNIEFPEYLDE